MAAGDEADTGPGTTWWEHTAGHATAHSFKRFEKQYEYLCKACLH